MDTSNKELIDKFSRYTALRVVKTEYAMACAGHIMVIVWVCAVLLIDEPFFTTFVLGASLVFAINKLAATSRIMNEIDEYLKKGNPTFPKE